MSRMLLLFAIACVGSAAHAQDFTYVMDPLEIEYDVATGVGTGTLRITNQETLLPGAPPSNVQGWSLAFTVDPMALTPISVDQGLYIQTVNQGGPPAFWTTNVCNDGVSIGCVYSLLGLAICTYEVAKEIATIEVETFAATWIGDSVGGTASFNGVSPSCTTPPVLNGVVVGGATLPPMWSFGPIDLVPLGGDDFLRGDANNDGVVQTIPDAIALLSSLFSGTGPIACNKAGDINDDGAVNLADPIYLLDWGFTSGPLPPAPFPSCGTESTPDALDCVLTTC